MNSATRRTDNIYWSFRRHLHAGIGATERIFFDPVSQPQPEDVDRWLIYDSGGVEAGLFSEVSTTIHCVSRNDTEGDVLAGLAADVTALFDRTRVNRSIDFYDKTTGAVVGSIDVQSVSVGARTPYSTGIQSIPVFIFSRVKTARNR